MPKDKRSSVSGSSRPGPLPTGAKGGLGQHFLKNIQVVKNIVQKAAIKTTDIVLEIGPGAGIMTMELLKLAKKVIAVEIDPRMIAEVQKKVQGTYIIFLWLYIIIVNMNLMYKLFMVMHWNVNYLTLMYVLQIFHIKYKNNQVLYF